MAFIGIEGKFGVEIPMPHLRLPGLGQLRIWKRERDEARAQRLEALRALDKRANRRANCTTSQRIIAKLALQVFQPL